MATYPLGTRAFHLCVMGFLLLMPSVALRVRSSAELSSLSKVITKRTLSTMMGVWLIGGVFVSTSSAKIPMMEDFYQTSGTKIESSVDLKPAVPIAGKDLKETIVLSFNEAKGLKDTIRKQNWEELLKSRKIFKTVRSQYFGEESVKALARVLGVSTQAAQDIESSREDINFSLEELNEFSLRHRVVVFNTEDLKQIALTGDGSGNLVTAEDENELSVLASSIIDNFSNILEKL